MAFGECLCDIQPGLTKNDGTHFCLTLFKLIKAPGRNLGTGGGSKCHCKIETRPVTEWRFQVHTLSCPITWGCQISIWNRHFSKAVECQKFNNDIFWLAAMFSPMCLMRILQAYSSLAISSEEINITASSLNTAERAFVQTRMYRD